jgi:hypothetical protein
VLLAFAMAPFVLALTACSDDGADAPAPTPPESATSTSRPSQQNGSAYPDATNTGVPAGIDLRSVPGELTSGPGWHYDPQGWIVIDVDGATLEGITTLAAVHVSASNVTVTHARISSPTSGEADPIIWVQDGVKGVRIEDVEVTGTGTSGAAGSTGIAGSATVVRSDISGVENGITPGSGSVLRDNYIHDLDAPGDPHIDGIQMDGGLSDITIDHNTVDMREWGQTATVMIDNYFGSISDIKVNNNRLLGGGYTVYSDGQFNNGSMTGISFTDNRLGRGHWGYKLIRNSSPTWTGNVDDATGAPID